MKTATLLLQIINIKWQKADLFQCVLLHHVLLLINHCDRNDSVEYIVLLVSYVCCHLKSELLRIQCQLAVGKSAASIRCQ